MCYYAKDIRYEALFQSTYQNTAAANQQKVLLVLLANRMYGSICPARPPHMILYRVVLVMITNYVTVTVFGIILILVPPEDVFPLHRGCMYQGQLSLYGTTTTPTIVTITGTYLRG